MTDWPHSPTHRLESAGAYMVTSGTYRKEPLLNSHERLSLLCESLLKLANQYDWRLQAWCVFPNHYHIVALSPEKPASLRAFLQHLHSVTAIEINRADRCPGRKVWFEYWDTHIRNQKSFYARLSYVHNNAVRHGIVKAASNYAWCSAGWLERRASRAFYRTVMDFPHSRVVVKDDYLVDPLPPT